MNNLYAFLPMRSSNDLLDDPERLQDRMAEDGYLYFEQILDVERVRGVRRDVLTTLSSLGWTEPLSFPISDRTLIAPLREEDPEYRAGYREIQKIESFHTLAHDPDLMAVMRAVLGETAFPHPLKIARIAFPDHYDVSTPPHQDYPNNQGTERLTAAWIPLGDYGTDYGGLSILRGSHKWGTLPVSAHIGAGNRCAVIPPDMAEECRWVTTEFRLGDVLVFGSQTVHAALHNVSAVSVRLSVDFRYQTEGEALTPLCLEPHFQQISWEEIYAGWKSRQYQYYWRGLDYEEVDWSAFPLEGNTTPPEVTVDEIDQYLDRDTIRQVMRYTAKTAARMKRRFGSGGAASPGREPEKDVTG